MNVTSNGYFTTQYLDTHQRLPRSQRPRHGYDELDEVDDDMMADYLEFRRARSRDPSREYRNHLAPPHHAHRAVSDLSARGGAQWTGPERSQYERYPGHTPTSANGSPSITHARVPLLPQPRIPLLPQGRARGNGSLPPSFAALPHPRHRTPSPQPLLFGREPSPESQAPLFHTVNEHVGSKPASGKLTVPLLPHLAPGSPETQKLFKASPEMAKSLPKLPETKADELEAVDTPADLVAIGTKKMRRRQELTVSNVNDPDYLAKGITPADLCYIDGRGVYERADRERRREIDDFGRSTHPLRDPFAQNDDDDYYGYDDDEPRRRNKPYEGYYINQKERYDAAEEVKPTLYTHRTLREVFNNHAEPHAVYNPMEFVFDRKQEGKVKRALHTVKKTMGKEDYDNYDYFEHKQRLLKKQDLERQREEEKKRAAQEALLAELEKATASLVFEDALAENPGDAIYNVDLQPRGPKQMLNLKPLTGLFKRNKWDTGGWNDYDLVAKLKKDKKQSAKTAADIVFEGPPLITLSGSPAHESHPTFPPDDLPASSRTSVDQQLQEILASDHSEGPSGTPHLDTTTLNSLPTHITRPDLESIASEFTADSVTPAPSHVTITVAESEVDPVIESSSSPLPTKQKKMGGDKLWLKWNSWDAYQDGPAAAPKPKVKKEKGPGKFSNWRKNYTTAVSQWNGGGAPAAAAAPSRPALIAPLRRSAPLIRLVRTRGSQKELVMDHDGESVISKELYYNPLTKQLEPNPPTLSGLMISGKEEAAAAGGGGIFARIMPYVHKVPHVSGYIEKASPYLAYGSAVTPYLSKAGPYVRQAHPLNFTDRLRQFDFIRMAFRPLDEFAERFPFLTFPIHVLECFFFLWIMWEASKLLDLLVKIIRVVLSPFTILGGAVFKL